MTCYLGRLGIVSGGGDGGIIVGELADYGGHPRSVRQLLLQQGEHMLVVVNREKAITC